MQPENPYVLTPERNRRIFIDRIIPARFRHAAHLKTPELHIGGGQPGSGKSHMLGNIIVDLEERFGKDSVVSIIGDNFRAFHPEYKKLLKIDPYRGADYTSPDAARWVEQAIALTAEQGNCVVVEGTGRNPEANIQIAFYYQKHGFAAHLHVMAIHEFESRLRIFLRYFEQLENEGHGRYARREIHDRAYSVLPESVAAMVNSSLFKTITLYNQYQTHIHYQFTRIGRRQECVSRI